MPRAAWIVACAPVVTPGPGSEPSPPEDVTGPGSEPTPATFRVTLQAIAANEAGTAADASVEGLSLTGTNLTVAR